MLPVKAEPYRYLSLSLSLDNNISLSLSVCVERELEKYLKTHYPDETLSGTTGTCGERERGREKEREREREMCTGQGGVSSAVYGTDNKDSLSLSVVISARNHNLKNYW